MKDWKPQAKALSAEEGKSLSVEEVLVLACLDGQTSIGEIPYTTGMAPDVVREIMERLESRGAIEGDAGDGAPGSTHAHDAAPPADVGADDVVDGPDAGEAAAPEEAADPTEVADDASLEQQSATYRKLYETQLAHLTRDERLARVSGAIEPELSAFCFDAEPVVIHRLFENSHAGLAHARLIASHHRTSTGLEILTKHQSLLNDGQVQRLLLRNGMLPQSLFTRILQPKRLPDIYRTTLSHDIPERTKVWSKNLLRQKWPVAQPEERVELLWQTEARVLPTLQGCHIDAKTTVLLCKRPIVSVIFIRNFATWAATPPPLIAHMLKQPLVKRMPQLRNMLLRHPNTPSEAKRKG